MVDGEVESREVFICWPVDPLLQNFLVRFVVCHTHLRYVVLNCVFEDHLKALWVVLERRVGKGSVLALLLQGDDINFISLHAKQLFEVVMIVVGDALEHGLASSVGLVSQLARYH